MMKNFRTLVSEHSKKEDIELKEAAQKIEDEIKKMLNVKYAIYQDQFLTAIEDELVNYIDDAGDFTDLAEQIQEFLDDNREKLTTQLTTMTMKKI